MQIIEKVSVRAFTPSTGKMKFQASTSYGVWATIIGYGETIQECLTDFENRYKEKKGRKPQYQWQ